MWVVPPSLPAPDSHIPPSSPRVSQHPPGKGTEEACAGVTVPEPEGRELDQACGCAKPRREVSAACGEFALASPLLQHVDCTLARAHINAASAC